MLDSGTIAYSVRLHGIELLNNLVVQTLTQEILLESLKIGMIRGSVPIVKPATMANFGKDFKMSQKPVIGMNAEFRSARQDVDPLSWINSGCYDSVTAVGGLPMIIPPMNEEESIKQMLSMVDGLILTGCVLDLDPIRMGKTPHPATRAMPRRREDFDRKLAKLAVELKIPTLAIGSGMQLMNLICGGTLMQHIPEDLSRAIPHRDSAEPNLRHVIEIVPGTRVDQIYGPGEIRINSMHHMGIDLVAETFRVSATCPDGVIEAYESIDESWFCLGVQWHPENETASALDLQVFEHFLDAIQLGKQSQETLPEILQINEHSTHRSAA